MARANERESPLGLSQVDDASFTSGTEDLTSSHVGTCDSSSSGRRSRSSSTTTYCATSTRSSSSAETGRNVDGSRGLKNNREKDWRGGHQSPLFPSSKNKSRSLNRDRNHNDRKRERGFSSGDSE